MNDGDIALSLKYDVSGPRYTSYPSVPCWERTPSPEVWAAELDGALARAERQGLGAAVYVHVPFCRSLCTYCGCTTRITTKPVGAGYVATVLEEWRLLRRALGRPRVPIDELHLGGGTPTFLSPDELAALIDGLVDGGARAGAAFSLEADPRVTTRAQLEVLAARGFSRLSLGVQDFDARVQRAIHRVQHEADVAAVSDAARAVGFTGVGFDLVYGLPHQTLASIEATVAAVVRLAPDRVAFYGYAHVPWVKKAQRGFDEADLPDVVLRRALYERGRELLVAAGYRAIAMDHFALPHDPLAVAAADGTLQRDFMGYTTRRIEPLIGLGASAIGDSGGAFAQNDKDVDGYAGRVARGELPIVRGHVLDAEDRVLRAHIVALMTRFATTWERGGAGWTPWLEGVPAALAGMVADGLVVVDARGCRVTARGERFVRNVCMAFDARLARRAPSQTPTFSRTA